MIDREEMVTDNISMLGQPMTNRSGSSKVSSMAFENFENVSSMFTCNAMIPLIVSNMQSCKHDQMLIGLWRQCSVHTCGVRNFTDEE